MASAERFDVMKVYIRNGMWYVTKGAKTWATPFRSTMPHYEVVEHLKLANPGWLVEVIDEYDLDLA